MKTVIAADLFPTDSVAAADIVLPAAGFAEKPGTTTNLEGRVTTLAAKVSVPGVARPDWMIAVELAAQLGADLGVASVEELTAEISATAPAYAGLADAIVTSRDGVVVPIPAPVAEAEPAVEPADATAEGDEPAAVAEPGVAVPTAVVFRSPARRLRCPSPTPTRCAS